MPRRVDLTERQLGARRMEGRAIQPIQCATALSEVEGQGARTLSIEGLAPLELRHTLPPPLTLRRTGRSRLPTEAAAAFGAAKVGGSLAALVRADTPRLPDGTPHVDHNVVRIQVLEEQRREVMAARQAILLGGTLSEIRQTLFQIDRAWREHLALAADARHQGAILDLDVPRQRLG